MSKQRRENSELPRGPVEELGAMKQRRITAKALVDSMAYVLDAAAVTVVVTLPEGSVGQHVTCVALSFTIPGPWARQQTPDDFSELLLAHLKAVDDQVPQQRAELERQLAHAKAVREATAKALAAEAEAAAPQVGEEEVPTLVPPEPPE